MSCMVAHTASVLLFYRMYVCMRACIQSLVCVLNIQLMQGWLGELSMCSYYSCKSTNLFHIII